MNEILSEKQYQREIIDYLTAHNGYIERKNADFDRNFAADRGMLFRFLDKTQGRTMAELRKIFKENTEETIINVINQTVTSEKCSLLEALKSGIEISNRHLDLMYTRPATTFNKTLNRLYDENLLSVMEEVWASDSERVDLVIFLNGLAIISIELKCNPAGQSYENAIAQYRKDRNPKTRLFRFKAGCIVNFAMDLHEVHSTTRIDAEKTRFLPFNMGCGEGISAGAGNPLFEDKYSVSYMWEDILTKDTLTDLISKFIFFEKKDETDELTGTKKHSETLIFPRFHQLDLIRKLLASVREHKTELNYLIEHSAGSGKTNSIAWLTYRLSSLHDRENRIIFDNVIIVTDRVVVDRQLQKAILGMDHQAGYIRVMDDKCTSADLAYELTHNTKIIATTIQKFPYIVDTVASLKNKHFAVIIDEAHSSTAGKDMQAVTQALGAGQQEYEDADDMIADQIERSGKQTNMSIFAFTATPKDKTLRLFGQLNPKGQYEPFHLYSMKQAIEEGYILDVLRNFTEYETIFRLNKEIEEDPEMKTDDARRQIARFIELHETNIAQRIEVIVEHFRTVVLTQGGLGGMEKAMVVTSSRQAAVKYQKAFRDYIKRKGYEGMDALVAFSGKVKLDGDDTEYTEPGINGFPENRTPRAFDSDAYNVLIVANKYQTGFDQKKLCAMYVLKKLKGVNAVQTYSRLNRICPPYNKKTFILDFMNTYAEIQESFSRFYTATLLSGGLNPKEIYDLEANLDAFMVLDPLDIQQFNEILFKERTKNASPKEKKALTFYLQKAEKAVRNYDEEKQREIRIRMRGFVHFYEFLLQASCFQDVEIHKKYIFITYLLSYLDVSGGNSGFDLTGKIRASDFVQKQGKTHPGGQLVSKPVVRLPEADGFALAEPTLKRLSRIIEEINSRTGKNYDTDVAVKAMLQIKDILLKSDRLRTSARNNSEKEFEFSFYDDIDEALIAGLEQNRDFFTLLLNNEELKRSVLGIFAGEIYQSLRER